MKKQIRIRNEWQEIPSQIQEERKGTMKNQDAITAAFLCGEMTCIHTIDCTQAAGADYFESAPAVIRHSLAGTYREAASVDYGRFAYRFCVRRVQTPHLAVIEYPDDRERTFCVMDGRTYDLSSGIATGREHPLSGRMQEHRLLFWPRWTDATIAFMSWRGNAPAAVARIRIYELDEACFHEPPRPRAESNGRMIGFQWEDACGQYISLGAWKKPDWSRRLAAYAGAIGQNLIKYNLSWYGGCLYPSAIEPVESIEQVITDEKGSLSINLFSTTYDWVAELLEELKPRGIDFMGVFFVYRFQRLLRMASGAYPLAFPVAGPIRTILSDGAEQRTPHDWTFSWTRARLMSYHNGRFDDVVEGEHTEEQHGVCAPMFNCFHPDVEAHLLALMTEIGQRYGRFDNFKGLTIPLWAGTCIWQASLRAGYDDYTADCFARETGCRPEVDPRDPERFRKRYEWLMRHGRDIWIAWRCRRAKALLGKMRAALAGSREDIKLVVSPCREPLFGQLQIGYHTDAGQLCNSGPLAGILREGGVDLELYDGRDGVEMELQLDPSRDRSLERYSGPTQWSNQMRDHDFLDDTTNDYIAASGNRHVFIFNCYYESVEYPFAELVRDITDDLKNLGSGIEVLLPCHISLAQKSIWPWFPCEFTTSPGVPPAGRNFLEYYAWALARFDARTISFGGLAVGTFGHEEELRAFSVAFRALPPEPFATVPANSDLVVLRRLEKDLDAWFYLVNTEPTDVEVTVRFSKPDSVLHPVPPEAAAPLHVKGVEGAFRLASYELKAFRIAGAARPEALDIKVPPEAAARLAQAKELLGHIRQSGKRLNWLEWLEHKLEANIESSAHSRLRHILESFPVRCLEMVERLRKRQQRYTLTEHSAFRVNCGAAEDCTDSRGRTWLADQPWTDGLLDWGYTDGKANPTVYDRTSPDLPEVYGTECDAVRGYRFIAPNGACRVTLHFMEHFHESAGQRVFDLAIQGMVVLKDLDIWGRACGRLKPLVLSFPVEVSTNLLTIDFIPVIGGAQINGIEIERITDEHRRRQN